MSETELSALVISRRDGLALKLPSKTILSHFASAFATEQRLDHFSEGFRSVLAILNTLQPKPL